MRLIKPSYEILEQKSGLEGIYEAVERAGRTCYKSTRPEGKTARHFIDMLLSKGHLSPLEHGTVYLKLPNNSWSNIHYTAHPYSRRNAVPGSWSYITTNYRVLLDHNWIDDLEYLCEPTEYHEKRIGVKVNCSIGISREWNRHRKLSICEQSTRYCNYSHNRFGNELTFITPYYLEDPNLNKSAEQVFIEDLKNSETSYFNLLRLGCIPQQAREVLPLSTATEVVYTGFTSDWEHFFELRCSSAAHPDIRRIAIPLREEFISRNYILKK